MATLTTENIINITELTESSPKQTDSIPCVDKNGNVKKISPFWLDNYNYNYMENGYNSEIPYRKIGECNIPLIDDQNWSFFAEIDLLYHVHTGVFERGTLLLTCRGRGFVINSNINAIYHSKDGRINYINQWKVGYKLDTKKKVLTIELLAFVYSSYTIIYFLPRIIKNSDMVMASKKSLFTWENTGVYKQSTETMKSGLSEGFKEVKLFINTLPLNGVYAQYSGMTNPTTLFGGTWENVTSTIAPTETKVTLWKRIS